MHERPASRGAAAVSVVTPVYNAEKYLVQTVESVLAQTCTDFEYYLVDDVSQDGSRQLVAELAARDHRIKPLFLDSNGGPARARNHGIAASTGEFVAFVDADDLWAPEKLERQLAAFCGRPELGVVGTNGRIIDAEGRRLERCIAAEKIRRGRISLADFLLKGVPLATSSVMVRRECLERCGRFKEAYRIGEDFELWMRIIQAYEVDILDEELLYYRRHDSNVTGDSLTSRYWKVQIFENEVLPCLEKLGAGRGDFLVKLQRLYISLGKMLAAAGRRQDADAVFAKALHLDAGRLLAAKAFYYRSINRLARR